MLFRLFFAFCCITAIMGLSPATAVELIPHQATYALKSKEGGGFGQAEGAVGILRYEIASTCDGWVVTVKSLIRLLGSGDKEHLLEWNSSSWEAKDGKEMRYALREAQDGEILNQKKGEIKFLKKGEPGVLTTILPERSETKIDNALLPTAHFIALLEALQKDESFFVATVFDPSIANHPVEISAAIGKANTIKDTLQNNEAIKRLENKKSWPVSLAFFTKMASDGTPDFEQSQVILENGIIGRMAFELAGIKIDTELQELKELPSADCQ